MNLFFYTDLAFLCLVYDRSQNLPMVRSTLYGDALNILLKEWAAEKRLSQDPIYQGFHTDLEKEMLAEIAYESFAENQLFFSEEEIIDRISIFLGDTLDAPEYLDGATVLNAIERQQGILVERATDTYSFSHLTLQEYLVAKHISSQWMIDAFVNDHLTDERWREVFLLLSGLAGRRSAELWKSMERKVNHLIQTPKAKTLLEWITELTHNTSGITEGLVHRVFFLTSALMAWNAPDINSAEAKLNAIASAIGIEGSALDHLTDINTSISFRLRNIANDIINIRNIANDIASDVAATRAIAITSTATRSRTLLNAISMAKSSAYENIRFRTAYGGFPSNVDFQSLAHELDVLETQIPKAEAPAIDWQAFTVYVNETYFKIFHLRKDLITLSCDEINLFEKYLAVVKLMFDCKDASVRVSRQQWESIESRLLTVPED